MTNTASMEGKALLNITELCSYLGIGQTKARELLRGCKALECRLVIAGMPIRKS